MSALTFSIVIPVYNNEETLVILYERLTEALKKLNEPYEIIFVNDASKDNSRVLLNRLGNNNTVTVIDLKENQGQWESTLLGISRAGSKYIITIDADLQYNPNDIQRLYNTLLEKNLLLVYGIPSRMLHGAGKMRNTLQNIILKKSTTSSFKIFHRSVVFNDSGSFKAERHFECHEKFQIPAGKKGSIEVDTSEKRHGGFRRHMLRNTNIMLTYLPEYQRRSLHPFMLIGVIVTGSGFLFYDKLVVFIPVVVAGIAFTLVGMIWQIKYIRVVKKRKQNLRAVSSYILPKSGTT